MFRTLCHCSMDIFTILASPFNTQIRIQKKLLGIGRFSEGLKIEIMGILFRYLARFLAIWASSYKPTACFIKNDTSFVLFQGRFFKKSRTKFLFPPRKFLFPLSISSEKIGKSLRIRARFLGQMILNSRGVHSLLSSLLKILTKIRSAF